MFPQLLRLLRQPRGNDGDVTILNNDQVQDDITDGALANGSVIVYVWRQKDAEIITEQLVGMNLPGGVVCYHGGMDAKSRSKAQGKFMRGKARVCVATVAFGLGINKSDVRGIIHLCLPSSPEHYLQEIGRAGRDGKPSQAFAIILENEIAHKYSLSFSDKTAFSQVKSLLLIIKNRIMDAYESDTVRANQINTTSLPISLPLTKTITAVDCKEESIQTLLSILEQDSPLSKKLFHIEGNIPDVLTVTLKRRSIEKLGEKETIARCIERCGIDLLDRERALTMDVATTTASNVEKFGGTAMEKGFAAYSFGMIQFSVVACAREMGVGAEPRNVYAALRRLQSEGEILIDFGSNSHGRSIHLNVNQNGLKLFHPTGASTEDQLDKLAKDIIDHVSEKDQNRSSKVIHMHRIMQEISMTEIESDVAENLPTKSRKLKVMQTMVRNYFNSDDSLGETRDDLKSLGLEIIEGNDLNIHDLLEKDIKLLFQHPSLVKSHKISSYSVAVDFGSINCFDYTALTIAKILHGIESPRTPVLDWYQNALWGKWRSYDFTSLLNGIQSMIQSEDRTCICSI